MSQKTNKKAIEDIDHLLLNTRRIAPNKNVLINFHPEIVFRDGTTLETFNLVHKQSDVIELINALNESAGRKISLVKIDGPKQKKHLTSR